MRELLGLDKAMHRQRGALDDNLAKLTQLDGDITQAEQELEGEEAANNPEKKLRIQELLNRLRDERSSSLEAAAANCEALRTQFSRLRTIFREQWVLPGVTGAIVSWLLKTAGSVAVWLSNICGL